MAQFLGKKVLSGNEYAMIGYTLRDTLSEYGPVSRGVCQCDEQMFLRKIVERKRVECTSTGARYFEDDGTERLLSQSFIISKYTFSDFSKSGAVIVIPNYSYQR